MKKNNSELKMRRRKIDISVKIEESVRFIRSKVRLRPKIAFVLGSGLGDFAEQFSNQKIVSAEKIPHYPRSSVAGHEGNLVFGKLRGVSVLAFQGRVHFYETGDLETVLYPIRLAHSLGIKTLIVTNAAGGVNRELKPGDLMLITDQINLTFENPLCDFGFRISDFGFKGSGVRLSMKNPRLYDDKLQQIIIDVAKEKRVEIRRGVYCGIKGPSYETAAEIEMIRRIGGDAVGMSTVNEVTLAAALGMQVAGISCITNLATGIDNEMLTHAEVTEVANLVKQPLAELFTGVLEKIGQKRR